LDEESFATRLADAAIAVEAIQMTEHRVMSALSAGKNPGPASSLLKMQGTEAMQRLDELAIEAVGHYAVVDQPAARLPGSNVAPVGPREGLLAMARYLNNRAASIYGVPTRSSAISSRAWYWDCEENEAPSDLPLAVSHARAPGSLRQGDRHPVRRTRRNP